jgi:hypothetical protein|tara:strand:- start:44 stop:502 length:459 start_codon:yes stop_codon:yes gene_type:complete
MKTKYISHRGNINGKVENLENSPRYIDSAIELGYDCEIDVWYHQHEFWLGHDEPTYQVDLTWLTDRHLKLWIHCKDLVTVSQFRYLQLNMLVDLNYFFHNTDDCTLTSRGDVWVYPGKQPLKGSIAVMPEIHNEDISVCSGICSDNIINYKK